MFLLTISDNILIIVCALGIVQGLLLALVIYYHATSDKAVNIFLAAYIGCISIVSSSAILFTIIPWQKTYTMEAFPLLLGPLLYLYIRSFKERITWRKAVPHFLPFLLYFAASYWYLSFLGGMFPNEKQVPADVIRHPVAVIHSIVKAFIFVLYYFLARRELNIYQRSIRHLFSETSRIDLRWTRWLINGYILLIIATIITYALIFKYPQYFTQLVLINVALATPYVYVASYKGCVQSSLWQLRPNFKKKEIEEELMEVEEIILKRSDEEKLKFQKVANENKIIEMASQIIAALERDKLYQESELTLQDLATKLQLSPHQVSQAINDGLKKNFYDVVNGYRVEEAKRLLLDPKNKSFTILSVAFEAGFNSKTTFNTVFKKFTGLTPSEFRQQQEMRIA